MTAPTVDKLVFQDTFTGSDGTAISARSPDVGSNWSFQSGADGSIIINGNAARPNISSTYPGYDTALAAGDNTYRLKFSVTIPSLVDGYAYIQLAPALSGARAYDVKVESYPGDNIYVSLVADPDGTGSHTDFSTFVTKSVGTISCELIVRDGLESWLYVDSVEVDHRVNGSVAAPNPAYLTLMMSHAGIKADNVEFYRSEGLTTGFTSTQFGNAQVVGLASSVPTQALFGTPYAPPAPVLDVATSAQVLTGIYQISTPEFSDPLAAYAAWATELGLSTSGTSIASVDDGITIIDPGIPLLTGSSETRVLVSSEGGIGLYSAVPASVASAGNTGISATSPQVGITRFYITSTRPSVVLSLKEPAIDGKTYNGKWGATASTFIFYMKWALYNNSNSKVVEAAIRIVQGRVQKIVARAGTTGYSAPRVQLFRFDETAASSVSSLGSGSYTALLASNTTTEFVGAPLAPSVYEPTGFQVTRFGRTEVASPGYITDTVTGARMVATFVKAGTPGYADADAAYAAWKSAFGITDSLLASGVSNAAISITTDVPTLLEGVVSYVTGSATGGFAFYHDTPSSFTGTGRPVTALPGSGQYDIADFWTWTLPSLLLSISPPANEMAIVTARSGLNTANDTTVAFFEWAYTTLTIEVAAKFQDGYIELVITPSGSGSTPYFQIFRIAQDGDSLASVGGEGTYVDALTIGTTAQYSTGSPPGVAIATGFQPTIFGTPEVVGLAEGFQPTTFGTPVAYPNHPAASLGELALFGTPHWPHLETVAATGEAPGTRFGKPTAPIIVPWYPHPRVDAWGWAETAFGTPSAAWPQTEGASGAVSTAFGTPLASWQFGASGFLVPTFGSSVAFAQQLATGFKSTAFGTAAATRSGTATGILFVTRFGLPRTVRPDTYPARGFRRTHLGRPTGYSRFNYLASGFTGTQLGEPGAVDVHRVFHLAPGTVFGTPLLDRGTSC